MRRVKEILCWCPKCRRGMRQSAQRAISWIFYLSKDPPRLLTATRDGDYLLTLDYDTP